MTIVNHFVTHSLRSGQVPGRSHMMEAQVQQARWGLLWKPAHAWRMAGRSYRLAALLVVADFLACGCALQVPAIAVSTFS